jgi:GT2 family glycosyltransferase
MSQRSIDVVIVNWNGGRGLLRAVRSAIRFGGNPIVVDNGSSDGSAELIEAGVPEATVIRLGSNTGFAHACNVGVAAGTGEYVFLLNPDAEIVAGTPEDLVAAFAFDRRVRIVGAAMRDAQGRPVRSVRRLPNPVSLALYQLKLHPLARVIPPLRRYFMLDFRGDRPAIVEQVMGAAFVMRRVDWERLGGMDEGYFLWFEEVDLSRRVAEEGGVSLFWPRIVVRHVGGASFARLPAPQRQAIWNRSVARYANRHFSRRAAMIVRALAPAATAGNRLADIARRIRHRTARLSGG